MQGLQGTLVVIIAAAACLAGIIGERFRAELARQAWRKRRWRKVEVGVPLKTGAAPITDPAEQLRLVMGASFKKRPPSLAVGSLRLVGRRKGNQNCGPQVACDGASKLR